MKLLYHIRTKSTMSFPIHSNNKVNLFAWIEVKGYTKTVEVYDCDDCSGCKHKVMKVNEVWVDLSAETHENIESERGILNEFNEA